MTCAKPAEAEVFAAAEIQDIRIAYPISPTYAARILSLMDGVRISTIVDDLGVAQGWSDAMVTAGRRLEVLVKIDVGTHRCGVDPRQRDAIGFIERVSGMPGLDLRGLLSHAGHSYAAGSVEEIADIARAEAAMMAELVEGCRARGIALEEISVGSTPIGAGERDAGRNHRTAPRQLRLSRPHAGRPWRRRLGRLRAASARVGHGLPRARPAGARLREQGAVLRWRPRVLGHAGIRRGPRARRATRSGPAHRAPVGRARRRSRDRADPAAHRRPGHRRPQPLLRRRQPHEPATWSPTARPCSRPARWTPGAWSTRL